MTIPAGVKADLAAFAAAVTAASPLEGATRILLTALQSQGQAVLAEIGTALAAAGAPLDADDPSGFAGSFPDALLALAEASENQSVLSDMLGLVGRALFNLAQVQP